MTVKFKDENDNTLTGSYIDKVRTYEDSIGHTIDKYLIKVSKGVVLIDPKDILNIIIPQESNYKSILKR